MVIFPVHLFSSGAILFLVNFYIRTKIQSVDSISSCSMPILHGIQTISLEQISASLPLGRQDPGLIFD